MKFRTLSYLLPLTLGLFPLQIQAETLTFGIVPQQSANKLAQLWTPITEYLQEKTGLNIKFATANNIPTFEKRLQAGEYDIAYMNPYHFTVFNKKPGYRAIAKQQDKKLKGIIVVRKESQFNSLKDLAGQTLSFPSEAAFAASILPRAEMKKEGIDFTPKYVSSHDSVYLTVSRDLFAAGGGVMRTFNNTDPKVKEKLRILWTTKGYTPHAIAVHPNMSPDIKDKLQSALVAMKDDEQGAALLERLKFNKLENAADSDWSDVDALGITLLEKLLD